MALAIFLTPPFFFHGHFEIKSLQDEMKSWPAPYRVYWGIVTEVARWKFIFLGIASGIKEYESVFEE